jgi:hypothetical protein
MSPIPTSKHAVFLACAALLACGQTNEPPAPAATAEEAPLAAKADPHAEHAHHPDPAAQAAEPLAPMPEPPAGARVFFEAPIEGKVITGPLDNGKIAVEVKMAAENIAIEPAGPVKEGSGHHHVLIDKAPLAKGTVVPKDEHNLHFGQAQTEATIALEPGKHTLTLQLADGIHRSYGEALAQTITVVAVAAGSASAEDKAQPAEQPAPVEK